MQISLPVTAIATVYRILNKCKKQESRQNNFRLSINATRGNETIWWFRLGGAWGSSPVPCIPFKAESDQGVQKHLGCLQGCRLHSLTCTLALFSFNICPLPAILWQYISGRSLGSVFLISHKYGKADIRTWNWAKGNLSPLSLFFFLSVRAVKLWTPLPD